MHIKKKEKAYINYQVLLIIKRVAPKKQNPTGF